LHLQEELLSTTLSQSFVKKKNLDGDSLPEVDEELNLLTHLIESQVSQQGYSGPVSNMLGLLGLAMPEPPSTAEDAVIQDIEDDV
jgi:hypothetical protein